MFKTRPRRRTQAVALAGMASALLASAAFPLLAGAETASPAVTVTASQTTGLVSGQTVSVHVDAVPPGNPSSSQIFGVQARVCKPGAAIDFAADFNPTQTGNCVLNPLAPGTDTITTVATAPPNQSADLNFVVGTGTDNYVDQSSNNVSITCNAFNPCKLVLKLQVPGATQFVSFPLTYAGSPDAPSAVTATAGDTTVDLSWTAPVNTGNAPIGAYVITPSIGGVPQAPITTPTNATNFTVTGLANFTAYTFTVAAKNVAGLPPTPAGIVGAASGPVPATPGPNPPTSVAGLAGDQSAALSWTAPVNTSGLDFYRITPYIGGVPGTPVNTPGTGTSFTVPGLTNGTTYTFSVAAHYAGGFGPDSVQSGPVTPNGTFVSQTLSADRPQGTLDIAEACATGGTLQFGSYPQTCAVNLGTGVLNGTATYYVATGAINTVSVRDLRDSDVGWNVNAQIGNFTTAGDSFSGNCLGFAPTATGLGGPVGYTQVIAAGTTTTGNCTSGLTTSTTVMTGGVLPHPGAGGLGRADLTGGLTLNIPVTANAGTYTATLTFTAI